METNVLNAACRSGVSGSTLKQLLKERQLAPAVGLHAIYEMARTFLNDDAKKIGAVLFSILRDLDPFYQIPPEMIYDQEIIKLRTGAAVLPVLDPINLAATKQEVERLARSIFDDNARNFISKREAEIRLNHPKFASNYISTVNKTLQRDKLKGKRFRAFEDVYSDLQDQLPDLIYRSLNGKVRRSEARELSLRLGSFPAIRSTARANAYLIQNLTYSLGVFPI